MRVPIPIAVIIIVFLLGVIWWSGTREKDFLTPPSEAELSAIRERTRMEIPPPPETTDAISVRKPLPPKVDPLPEKPVEPPLEMGDLKSPPTLSSYQDQASKGPGYLIELASLLENEGQFQRALLAWERVLDSTRPDETQARAALAAIKRLRPTLPDWNEDGTKGTALTLYAGTNRTRAKSLKPQLEEMAKSLSRFSSGILKVTPTINVGKAKATADGPAPVALWLAGPQKDSASTEIASFAAASPEELRKEALSTVYSLLRSHLGRSSTQPPPLPAAEGEDPADSLEYRVTRLQWERLGTALNQKAPANP